jgi:hypothetical protein
MREILLAICHLPHALLALWAVFRLAPMLRRIERQMEGRR